MMSVIEIELFSGFKAPDISLEVKHRSIAFNLFFEMRIVYQALLKLPNLGVKRYESVGRVLKLYLEQVGYLSLIENCGR